jgi:cytochrome c-type biogenesis protein CcmH
VRSAARRAGPLLAALLWAGAAWAQPAPGPEPRGPGAGRADDVAELGGVGAPPTEAELARVQSIGATLRCVVCQALSVADSPSTTAQQMRAIILEQLRAGKTPEEIRAYFVSRYGEWVLLAPPRAGFNLLAWWLPYVALGLGALGVVLAARRWVRAGKAARAGTPEPSRPAGPRAGTEGPPAAGDAVSPEDRERLARELAALRR